MSQEKTFEIGERVVFWKGNRTGAIVAIHGEWVKVKWDPYKQSKHCMTGTTMIRNIIKIGDYYCVHSGGI